MALHTIALFGEAEKGEYHHPYFCKTVSELASYFGNPPNESRGLYFAVQALLYDYHLLFLRVEEEGYSINDYLTGVNLLKEQTHITQFVAICMPGVGENKILNAVQPICDQHHAIIITNEADLYDLLT